MSEQGPSAEKDAGLRDRIRQVADAYQRSWQRTPGASTLDTDVAQMLRNLLIENHPAWSERRAENDGGLTDEQREWLDSDNGAYYYSLDRTGVPAIDRILSAICYAGKAFHNTSEWNETNTWDYGPIKAGMSPIDLIQAAADEAARVLPPAVTRPTDATNGAGVGTGVGDE